MSEVAAGEIATAAKWRRDTKKILGRARRTTDSSTSASTTLVAVLRLDDIPITGGRLHRISTSPLSLDSSTANDVIRASILYTTDGTTPTTSSTQLPGGIAQTSQPNAAAGEFPSAISTTYTPASDETLSLLLCVSRISGGGNCLIQANGTVTIIEILVTDLGIDPGDTGTDL